MLEALKGYTTLLGFLNIKNITAEKLTMVLGMAGFQLNQDFAGIIVEMLKEAQASRQINSLADVLKDEALMNEITSLIAAANEKGGLIQHHADVEVDNSQLVDVNAIVKCPHCEKPFGLIDAPGLRDHLLNQ